MMGLIMSNYLYLDIETIPSQHKWVAEHIESNLTPPKNYKDQERIDKWKDEALSEKLDKAGLDGATNHIICIGYAINDEKSSAFYVTNYTAEKQLLIDVFKKFESLQYPIIVGHNIVGFDLKIIKQRAMVHGIRIPTNFPLNPKPWDNNPYDTMTQWDAKNYISMDMLAKVFGIEGKQDIDGSQVYEMWKQGKFKEIVKYCKSDVDMVRSIHKKMNFI